METSITGNGVVERTLITEPDEKSQVFTDMFQGRLVMGETLVYRWMDKLCNGYNGGIWHIYRLSNGAFYMAPNVNGNYIVECFGFGDTVVMSADAAGLVATLFAVNQMANQFQEDSLIQLYYFIREYAGQHREAAKIFRAID